MPTIAPHAVFGARRRRVPCPPPSLVPLRDRDGFNGTEVPRCLPTLRVGGVQAAKVIRPDVGDAWGVLVELDPIVVTRLVEANLLTNLI